MLIVAFVYMDHVIIERHIVLSEKNVQSSLTRLNNRLTLNLYNNIQVVKGLPALLAVNPSLSQREFVLATKQLFDGQNQLRNIAGAPDLVIQYMYPIKGNEAAIGLDYRTLPLQIDAVLKAKESHQLVLAGPLKLVQGGMGLISRLPVYLNDAEGKEFFWGMIAAVIDVDLLYQRSGLLDVDLPIEIAIRGKDGEGKFGDVFFGSPDLFEQHNIGSTVTLPNGSWQIVARPLGGWTPKPEDIWTTRIYLSLAGLLLFGLFFAFLRASMNASIANLRFHTLFESSSDAIMISNEGRFLDGNQAMLDLFGCLTKEDLCTQTIADVSPVKQPCGTSSAVLVEKWTAVAVDKGGCTFEWVHKRLDNGEPFLAEILLSTLLVDKRVLIQATIRNITERKKAAEKLHLSARVFSDTHEGITITDANKLIIDVNPAFSKITGYSREDVLGKDPKILRSGKHDPDFYQGMWQQINQDGHWQGEVWNRTKSGELYAELLTISVLHDDEGEVVNYVGVFSDITSSKQQQEQLHMMAHYDVLTGLPNRVLFVDRFKQAIAHSKRAEQQLAVCFLDLDNFKPINDNFGHEIGDQLLIKVSNRLTECIRDEDTVSRQGGDEFALLLNNIQSEEQVEQMLERLHNSLAQPYLIEEHSHNITASIGVTLYPDDDGDIDTLLRHADNAMYQAKLAGKHRYSIFNTTQNQELVLKHHRLDEIKQALVNNEFQLYYQPKVNMITGEVFGAEALIRWLHPEKGLIPPLDFLPIIEGNDLEIQLGDWVINEALQQIEDWLALDIKLEISVNIASYHLLSDTFIASLESTLAHYPEVDSQYLQLEILESSALGDLQVINTIIKICQSALGVKVALDDFGTGYSSLTHLRSLPADTIKIDQSFVRDMLDDPSDYAIIDGIIGLTDSFNRNVIAEGVETTNHGLMLLAMQCEEVQGYGIAKPMPATEFPSWLANNYTPNPEWLAYGNQYHTDKENRVKLFRLIAGRWKDKFIASIQSSAENTELSPIMDNRHCSCGTWIQRAIEEQQFELEGLTRLHDAHIEIHAIAQTILLQYQAGHLERAREALSSLCTAYDKQERALDSLNDPRA